MARYVLSIITLCSADTPPPENEEAEKKEEKKGSDYYNIHLVLPGVPAPIDIMVSRLGWNYYSPVFWWIKHFSETSIKFLLHCTLYLVCVETGISCSKAQLVAMQWLI